MPNIGVKVFMCVTQRLLERNRDVFKPIMLHLVISGLQVAKNEANLPERQLTTHLSPNQQSDHTCWVSDTDLTSIAADHQEIFTRVHC
jgi:hypothetical protein